MDLLNPREHGLGLADYDYGVRIDTDGTLAELRRKMAEMPLGVEKAKRRAMRKLMTWMKRQVLREVAKSAGTTQIVINNLSRVVPRLSADASSIEIWIGTNPIAAHRLGTVRWARPMKGARVGRRLFRGTWSWGPGSLTGTAIMERTGEFGRRPRNPRNQYEKRTDRLEKIDKVYFDIHFDVKYRIKRLLPEIEDRFERLMLQELNYAFNVEAKR